MPTKRRSSIKLKSRKVFDPDKLFLVYSGSNDRPFSPVRPKSGLRSRKGSKKKLRPKDSPSSESNDDATVNAEPLPQKLVLEMHNCKPRISALPKPRGRTPRSSTVSLKKLREVEEGDRLFTRTDSEEGLMARRSSRHPSVPKFRKKRATWLNVELDSWVDVPSKGTYKISETKKPEPVGKWGRLTAGHSAASFQKGELMKDLMRKKSNNSAEEENNKGPQSSLGVQTDGTKRNHHGFTFSGRGVFGSQEFKNKEVFSPGPAAYSLRKQKVNGGVFNLSNPKSDIEWIMYRAAQIPGPLDTVVPDAPLPKGGAFNTSNPKSDIEWQIYRASKTPGPADIVLPNPPLPKGGKFSSANPKSDVEWSIYRAKQLPGPGEYKMKSTLNRAGMGRIGTGYPKSDVEWKMYRAKQIPGPGEYPMPSTISKTNGRRFYKAKRFEIIGETEESPGPADTVW